MQLTTPRLRIRPMAEGDFRLFANLAQDEEVMEFIRKPDTNDATSRIKFEECLQIPSVHPNFGLFIVSEKTTNLDLGWIMLKPDIEGIPCHEIGYRYAQHAWGKGYAGEAAIAVADYARDVLNFKHLVGITHQDNEPSKRVLEKAGLEQLAGSFSFFELEVHLHVWGKPPEATQLAFDARRIELPSAL